MSETTNWKERALTEADAILSECAIPARAGEREAVAAGWLGGYNAGSLETLRATQEGIQEVAQALVRRMGAA